MTHPTAPGASAAKKSPPRRRRWTTWNIVRLLLAIILVTELSLRLIFGLGNPLRYQLDNQCGYLPVADQDIRRFFCHNHINHFNMRSADTTEHKSPGHYRVLFVGDSVTYGTTFVDQSQIFTTLLANDLPPIAGKPVDVLNASAGGWAPANELGFLQGHGTFDADLILFVLNTADLNQPFASLTPGDANYPTSKPWFALSETWSRYLKPRLFHAAPAADPGSTANGDPHIATETPKVLGQLSQAADFARAHAAKFAIVFSPAHSPEWDKPEWKDGFTLLVTWANQHHVPLIDLTPDYASHPLSEIYQTGGIHLQPAGHQIVAARMEKEWPTLTK